MRSQFRKETAGAVAQPSAGGHNQGLPARSSVKTGHWPVFRALRTPFREPPRLCLSSLRDSRAAKAQRMNFCSAGVARARRKSQWLFLTEQRAGRPWYAPLRKNSPRTAHVAAADLKWRGFQGLPARSSLKLSHWLNFRALRTPPNLPEIVDFQTITVAQLFLNSIFVDRRRGVAASVLQQPL